MKAHPVNRTTSALTLIETLLIVAVLVVLVALILPALARAKRKSSRINCVSALKQVGTAFRLWAEDNSAKYPMQVSVTNGGTMELVQSGLVFPHFQVMSNELGTPKILVCPDDPERTAAWTFATNMNDSQVSYFVGVDATPNQPAMLLSGDRQITLDRVLLKPRLHSLSANQNLGWPEQIHWYKSSRNTGNILLADGSVQQADARGLRELLEKSGVTNRLAIP